MTVEPTRRDSPAGLSAHVSGCTPSISTGQRAGLFIAYAIVATMLCVPAGQALWASGHWSQPTLVRATILLVLPAVLLVQSVTTRRFSLAWSVFWVWSFIFLGLAPSFQLAQGRLPWGAPLHEVEVESAQLIVLCGHAVVIVAYFLASRLLRVSTGQATPLQRVGGDRLRLTVNVLIGVHSAVAIAFALLMGAALFQGRSVFSSRLVELSDTPGTGTLYFLATAGAVVIPATAITLRKLGHSVAVPLIVFSAGVSFLVVNPFIGSRFLTGSFLVAVVAAVISANARRWLSLGLILLFVTVFPALDLLRGDGTGATRIEFTDPKSTLVGLDYDAFEMLYRAATLGGEIPAGLATRAELLLAPFLRWVPVASNYVQGDASGPVVAQATGMGFTNVSMPLWGEAYLIGGWPGVIVTFAAIGVLLTLTRRAVSLTGVLLEAPVAALLFIILRGSLYEVLGYLLFAVLVAAVVAVAAGKATGVRSPGFTASFRSAQKRPRR